MVIAEERWELSSCRSESWIIATSPVRSPKRDQAMRTLSLDVVPGLACDSWRIRVAIQDSLK